MTALNKAQRRFSTRPNVPFRAQQREQESRSRCPSARLTELPSALGAVDAADRFRVGDHARPAKHRTPCQNDGHRHPTSSAGTSVVALVRSTRDVEPDVRKLDARIQSRRYGRLAPSLVERRERSRWKVVRYLRRPGARTVTEERRLNRKPCQGPSPGVPDSWLAMAGSNGFVTTNMLGGLALGGHECG